MGFAQERFALSVQLEHIPKHVLQCLAFRACSICGHARPGVTQLTLDTGLGERTVRDALVELRNRPDLLKVYRYPKGGRAVTTEYIVVPQLAKVIPTECPDWGKHDNTLRRAQALTKRGRLNPAPERTKTLRTTADHPSDTLPSISARGAPPGPNGPGVEPLNPPPPLSEPPPPATPTPAANAIATVMAMLGRGCEALPVDTKPGSHRGS
jgi:hypothetical protein